MNAGSLSMNAGYRYMSGFRIWDFGGADKTVFWISGVAPTKIFEHGQNHERYLSGQNHP